VEIFPFEDDPDTVLYGRLIANGADMDKLESTTATTARQVR